MKRKQQTGQIENGGKGEAHPGNVKASHSNTHGKAHGMKRPEYSKRNSISPTPSRKSSGLSKTSATTVRL